MTDTWLVAHDFSPCSDAAAVEAARMMAPLGGKLVLFHVHPIDHLRPEMQWGEDTFELEQSLRARLGLLESALRDRYPALDIEVDVTAGEVVRSILEEATRLSADHIVVGTHGRRGVAHLVLGSVAEKVVREARVPVLVVRGPRIGAAVMVDATAG